MGKAVMGHDGAADFGAQSQLVLLQEMSSESKPMFAAPLADLFGITFAVPFGDGAPVIVAGFLLTLTVKEDHRKGVKDVVPPSFPEEFREGIAPGKPSAVVLKVGMAIRQTGFVGEDTGDGFTELLLKTGGIFFVGRFDEAAHRSRVEVVGRRLIVKPGGLKTDFGAPVP